MERKNILKKSISLLLIISLMLGLTWTGTWAQAATDVPSELAGYTRLTPESFGITEEVAHTYDGSNIEQNYYVQSAVDFNKAYFDADISLTDTGISSGFGYLNTNLIRVYIVDGTLVVYSLQGATLMYQTELSSLGITTGEYFNLKLATDITEGEDTANADVKVQVWANNTKLTAQDDTVTVPDAYVGSWLSAVLTGAGTIKIRPHVESEPQDPLAGYTKIGPENFGITEEVAHTYEGSTIEQAYGGATSCMDQKVYFDADVMLPVGGLQSNNIAYLNQWLLRVYLTETELVVYSTAKDMVVLYQTSCEDLGIEAGQYFHLKLATDMTDNASDSGLTDIKVQLWVNDALVTPKDDTITVYDGHAAGTNLYVNMTQAGTIKIRPHVEGGSDEPDEPQGPVDPLEGFTKVTPENFGITAEASQTYSGTTIEQTYGGATSYIDQKSYFDADVMLPVGGLQSNNIAYLNQYLLRVYLTEAELVVYSTAKDPVLLYQTPWTDLGITAGEYFHLKLATEMTDNASDSSLTDIKVQLWVNDALVTPIDDTITVSDGHAAGTNLYVNMTQAGTIKIRPHVEQGPVDPANPLEGYTKIGLDAFGITEETIHTFEGSNIEKNYYVNGVESFDKTYLDANIALTQTSVYNGLGYLNPYLFRIYMVDNTFAVYSLEAATLIYQEELSTLGLAEGEYFNLKFATDISNNADDDAKTDVKVQIWINDNQLELANDKVTVGDAYVGNALNVTLIQDGSIKLKPTSAQNPDSEIPGYTKVGPEHFGIFQETVFTHEGSNIEKNYYVSGVESFDKTYLDVDIALTQTSVYNGLGYLNPYLFRIYMVDNTFAVYSLEAATLIYQEELSTLGLVEGEYFNLKFATDISDNAEDESKTDVKVQIWINDNQLELANDKVTVGDAYVGNVLNVTLVQDGTIKIKPQEGQGPVDPDTPDGSDTPTNPENTDWKEVLKDYGRVTPQSFAIIEETFTHGWTEGNWMGYEYPESLDHTYFDVDISLCKDDTFNNAIRYLSANGWESLLIGITGDKLQVYETTTGTVVYQVSLTELGIKADEFFNMKLSTDISEDTITLSLWINNKLVRSTKGETFAVVKGCTKIGNMLGVYLPYEGTICMKTPIVSGGEEQKPVETEQPNPNFKELTFGSFAVEDGKYSYIGTELATKGTYILSVNETVFSGDFHFSKEGGADFRYGGKGNPWNGLRFWTTGDGKLYMQDATQKTEIYAFHPLYAGVQLVDNTFNMKLGIEFVDSDKDGAKDDVKLGVWFNDVLYQNSYIYLTDYASELGNACSVYVMNKDSWISIASDKAVYTGVDFTLFGFTTNWKKELGIK